MSKIHLEPSSGIIGIAVIYLTCLYGILPAQNKKVYRASVSTMNEQPDIQGTIFDVTDSTLVISTFNGKGKSQPSDQSKVTIKYHNIQAIKIRKRGSISKGAGLGAFTGAVTGVTLGLISNASAPESFFTPASEAMMGAMVLAPVGALVGTFVGMSNTRIKIEGDYSNFKTKKNQLMSYCYRWQDPVVKASSDSW